MTKKISLVANSVASKGTEIIATNPEEGPESIEGFYDEVYSIPGLLSEIRKGVKLGCEGNIIACYDDTGLDLSLIHI